MPAGRKRDESRDAAILDAALEELLEVGYDALTTDSVAARAQAGKATVYRRWPSKAHVVVDAVKRMSEREVGLQDLPDTGTLRGDLLGLIRPEALSEGQRRLKIMGSVAAMRVALDDDTLAEAAVSASTRPWITANEIMIGRAVDRGETTDLPDVEAMARIVPALCYFRVTVQGLALTPDYVRSLIDDVLLPALGIAPS